MKLWEIFLKPSSLLLGMVEAIDALNAVLIAVKIWEEPEEMLTAVEYRPEFYATKGVNYVESKEILSNRHKRRID